MSFDTELAWGSLELVLRSPCCCRYCNRRISVLEKLGLGHEVVDGGVIFSKDKLNGKYLVLLDDPGCYPSRTINGWGTIFTCYGLYEDRPRLLVRLYDLDYKYIFVDELILRRVDARVSYYYSQREYMERSLIAIPYPTKIPRTASIHDIFQPESIISQALGIALAIQHDFNILLVHTSTIFFLKHLLLNKPLRETRKILIIPHKAVEKYDIIKTVAEKLNIMNIGIECSNTSIMECIRENYLKALKIIEELSL